MRIRRVDHKIVEGDLTPMIDMTFQLIAFFMVVINFTETEHDERIKLPASELAKPGPAIAHPIYLNMTDNGEIVLDGQLVRLSGLRPYLVREGDQLEKNNKTRADATVIIRAHLDVQTGRVQRLIQACQEAGFEKFSFRAKERIGP